jgi:YegS/Rv2252/BmrU family lipid kinase
MIAAIVNPHSAGGKTGKRWPEIARRLQHRLGSVTVRCTEAPGQAIALARELLQGGFGTIIAAGGDGTANEVVNGFFQDGQPLRPDAQFALLPMGTGGDLQRTLAIPSNLDAAIEVLAKGTPRRIDLGRAQFDGRARLFMNLTSFGMGGEVAARSRNVLSPVSGKLAFLYATINVFVRYRPKTVRLRLDGRDAGTFSILNIAVGNGRYHGGGMHVCPRAVMDDGLLDVTVIHHLGLLELARDLPVLYSDDIYRHPKTRHFRAAHVEAVSDEPAHIEVDGEPLGRLPIDISVMPAAIEVLAPK